MLTEAGRAGDYLKVTLDISLFELLHADFKRVVLRESALQITLGSQTLGVLAITLATGCAVAAIGPRW